MSNNKELLQKYKSQIKDNENGIKNLKKAISSYGFRNCRSRNDFERKKFKFQHELEDVKNDILKAGSKNDSALVSSLKNREWRLKTKINEINHILVLFNKIHALNSEITILEEKIKNLGDNGMSADKERKQMNMVLKALRNNFSHEDAAKLANVEIKRIVNWIHEGRNETNKNKIYFFRQYSRIKSNKELKISKLLKHLRNGKTKDEACRLSYVSTSAFDIWYNYGRLGKDKLNVDFYKKVQIIHKSYGKRLMQI